MASATSGAGGDDESSEDEMLSFKDRFEMQAYMQKRIVELGFDQEVANALREYFQALEDIRSL